MSPEDKLTLITIGAVALPVLIPQVRTAVVSWLIDHDVMTHEGQGMFTVPFLEADITTQTLFLGVLLFLFAGLLVRMQVRSIRRRAADSHEHTGGRA